MKEGGREGTHLDVRLLITPVVVLYCSARAKMAAIPSKLYEGRQLTMWALTSQYEGINPHQFLNQNLALSPPA